MGQNLVDLEAVLINETELAWLLETENGTEIWMPKSVGTFDGDTLTVPEWFAKKMGLI